MAKTDCYLVLEPVHGWNGKLEGVTVDRITKSPPKLGARHVAVHLNIDVADALFEQFLPEVNIRVGDSRELMVPEIDVEPQTEPEDPEADNLDDTTF